MKQKELRKLIGELIDATEMEQEGACGDWAGSNRHMKELMQLINQHVSDVIGDCPNHKEYEKET